MPTFDAIYRYCIKDFERDTFNAFRARCVIVGETDKSYKIRLHDSIYNRLPNEELWVRKKSIEVRSYLDKESDKCILYDICPNISSCRACLNKCLTRYNALKDEQGR